MANNVQVNRRLLLAILRAPQFHAPSRTSLCHQTLASRTVSTSSSRHNLPSVSFGEETDQLIAALDPQKSRPKKRSPRVSEKGSEDVNKTRESKKLILARLERLDDMKQKKVKDSKGESKKVKAKTVNSTNGKDEAKSRTKRTKTAPKEKNGQGVPVKAEAKVPETTFQDVDILDEPVLLEILEPVSVSVSPLKIENIHNTKLTPSGRKPSSKSAGVSAASDPSVTAEPKVQAVSLRTPGSEPWQIQKHALQKKFIEGWQPRKKLSPDTLMGIRSLHERDPEKFSTESLSRQFAVSPEAIRRILRTKWGTTPEQLEERRQRWAQRHDRIWDHKAELGQRPQRRRDKKVDGPEKFEELIMQKQALGEI